MKQNPPDEGQAANIAQCTIAADRCHEQLYVRLTIGRIPVPGRCCLSAKPTGSMHVPFRGLIEAIPGQFSPGGAHNSLTLLLILILMFWCR